MLNNQPCNQNPSVEQPESSMNHSEHQERGTESMIYSSLSLPETEVKDQLTDQHWENATKERGLDPHWILANCYSVDIKQASEILHYQAKSGGIVIDTPTQIQLRPDKPWRSEKGKKAPKYRTPLKDDYDAILPTNPHDPSYWNDIEKLKSTAYNVDGTPCLLITEGGFKAIAGCSNGLPTLGLCGVEQGLTGSKYDPEGKRFLVPSLRHYAEHGFGFIIGFDADCASNKNVIDAEEKLAFQLEKFGVPVYSITGTWSEVDGKGMDDFIQAKGIEAFREKLVKAEKASEKYQKDDEGDEKKQKPPKPSEIGKELVENFKERWVYCIQFKSWLIYEWEAAGVWSVIDDELIEHLVFLELEYRELDIYRTNRYMSDLIGYLKNKLAISTWEEASRGYLPFNNGVYDLTSGKLHDHSPDFYLTWKLERDYSAIALDCDTILNFLARLANSNSRNYQLLLHYLAALLKGRFDLQKFLYLVGTGGSGKSTFLNLAQKLVGEKNTSTQSLEELEDKHNIMDLFGKRLLALPDQSPISTRKNGNFKRLTGGDPLSGRLLYKNTASFQFQGMSILTSNSFVFPGSAQNWLTRRMILIECNQIIPKQERASGIEKKMEGELEAFTNYLLSIPNETIENVLKGIDESEVNQYSWEYLCQSDGLAAWFNDEIVQEDDAVSPIGSDGYKWKSEEYDPQISSLYASYCHYCRNSGRTPKTTQTFSNDLIELAKQMLGWNVEKKLKKFGGQSKKSIIGLRLRTEQDEDTPLVEELLQEESQVTSPEGNHHNHQVTTKVTTPEAPPEAEGNHGNHQNVPTDESTTTSPLPNDSSNESSNSAVENNEKFEKNGYGGCSTSESNTDKGSEVVTPKDDQAVTGGKGDYSSLDFSTYPSRNSDDYRHKEKRANKCKEQMLACQTKQQLDAFKASGNFSHSEIKWVWNNLMSKQEKSKVKAISDTNQAELLSGEQPKSEHHRWVPLEAKPYGTENDLPQDEIEKLVVQQLLENGEMEEYHLIVAVGQKSPSVRQALGKVAVSSSGKYNDTPTNFWKLKS